MSKNLNSVVPVLYKHKFGYPLKKSNWWDTSQILIYHIFFLPSQALTSKIHIKFKVLVSSDTWPLNMIDDLDYSVS